MPSLSRQLYHFGEDFDLRQYYKNKGHIDRVILDVDEKLREHVASRETLAERGIELTTGLRDDLGGGVDRLSITSETISCSIPDLSPLLEYGFSFVCVELSNLGTRLDEILEMWNGSSHAWAYEKFQIARGHYLCGRSVEALESIEQALNGDGDNPGYELEHRFYHLRGLIRRGSYENHDEKIFNLALAKDDFLLAADCAARAGFLPDDHKEYSNEELKRVAEANRVGCARCRGEAGFTLYCMGDAPNAIEQLRQSLIVNPDDLISQYDLAKSLIASSHVAEARNVFSELIANEALYSLRASSDPDFLAHRDWIQRIMDERINKIKKQIMSDIGPIDAMLSAHVREIMERYNLAPKSKVSEHLLQIRKINELLPNIRLLEAVHVNQALPTLADSVKELLRQASATLTKKAEALRSAKRETYAEENGKRWLWGGGTCAAAVSGLPVFIYTIERTGSFVEGVTHGVVAGAVIGAIVGIPLGYIAGLIRKSIWEAGRIKKRMQAITKYQGDALLLLAQI